MKRIPNGRSTKEFRIEAAKSVTEGGLSDPIGLDLTIGSIGILN